MTNNKQQTAMKLYTEADLKKVISIYSEEYKTSTDEILKELNLTPIELPTDVVKQSTGVAINTENVSPELINHLTQNFDHDEDDYFGVIGMDNGSEEHKSLMESMSKMGMECRKGDNNATNNQTAVDIFHNRVNELIEEKKTITTFVIDGIWLECKEMEKQKLEDAWVEGFKNWNPSKTFEDYYNETYGDDKQ